MTYDKARQVLGFTAPRSVEELAKLAATYQDSLAPGAPLRFHTACAVLIKAGA